MKIYVNRAWTWFYVSPFAWSMESVNDNFPNFWLVCVINYPIFVWFCVKSLKLWKLGVNGISQFRTEVKHDSMKCKNCFWVWIFCEYEFTDPSFIRLCWNCKNSFGLGWVSGFNSFLVWKLQKFVHFWQMIWFLWTYDC